MSDGDGERMSREHVVWQKPMKKSCAHLFLMINEKLIIQKVEYTTSKNSVINSIPLLMKTALLGSGVLVL